MIVSPSVSQILRGIIHEIGGDFKDSLDPVKSAQINTIIGVLGSCAVRSDYQSQFIRQEADAIKDLTEKYLSAQHSPEILNKCLKNMEASESDEALYESASQTLSAMSDLGNVAEPELVAQLFALLEQRLVNEAKIIGGGFEAAGRG